MDRIISVFGIFTLIGIAWLFSTNKKRFPWRICIYGVILQITFCVLVLGVPAYGFSGPLQFVFRAANDSIIALLSFTHEGSRFIFGDLLNMEKSGFIFAVQVLPTIILMASLMAVLYHIGLMQKVILVFALIMQKTLRTSGAETLSASANIFVGQTEAPLIVRPFVDKMTKSELFCVMVGGMATIAGGVLVAYVGLLHHRIPGIAGHLLTASVLSAPAALLLAKVLIPEEQTPETLGHLPKETGPKPHRNIIEAAAAGALEGLHLALNVGAMLLAFIALIALANALLGWIGDLAGFQAWGQWMVPEALKTDAPSRLTFQLILGWVFAPFAFLIGVPSDEIFLAGALLGEKTVLNEFVAYVHLADISERMSDRTVVLLSYALSGFANFSSIAIQIGGIGGIAPQRRGELAQLGLRAVLGGTLAAFMTAAVVGIFL